MTDAAPTPPAPAPSPGERRGPGPGECRVCGAAPAAAVSFRQHVGKVFVMRAERREGPFCRDCGVATFRDLQNRTLMTGWWGVLSLLFFSWAIPLYNLRSLLEVRRLGPPVHDPVVLAPLPAPMDPGPPLWRRQGPLVAVTVVVVLAVVVLAAVVVAAHFAALEGPASGAGPGGPPIR